MRIKTLFAGFSSFSFDIVSTPDIFRRSDELSHTPLHNIIDIHKRNKRKKLQYISKCRIYISGWVSDSKKSAGARFHGHRKNGIQLHTFIQYIFFGIIVLYFISVMQYNSLIQFHCRYPARNDRERLKLIQIRFCHITRLNG